jgi:outer membrane protein TolC
MNRPEIGAEARTPSTSQSSATQRSTAICGRSSRSTDRSAARSRRRVRAGTTGDRPKQRAAIASYNSEKRSFPTLTIPPPVLLPAGRPARAGLLAVQHPLDVPVPLYDYGQRAAAHHAARAQIVSSLASLYNAYDSVEADVERGARNLATAAERLRWRSSPAQLGAETARIAQLQYKNGLISFTDVTQTEQTALSAQNDLLAARVQYVTALIKLRVALATGRAPAAAADLRGL